MSTPTDDARPARRLRVDDVEQLLDVVRTLAHKMEPDGVQYGLTRPRQAAHAFARALAEDPWTTLRHAIFALEEVGHEVTDAPDLDMLAMRERADT